MKHLIKRRKALSVHGPMSVGVNPMSLPIFVFGQARSGATLVQRLINSTNLALVSGEHLGMLKGIADSYTEFFEDEEAPAFCPDKTADRRHMERTVRRLRDPKGFASSNNGLTVSHVKNCYRSFVYSLCNPTGMNTRWGFKEIRYCAGKDFVVPMLHSLFPAARFVFMVRHPLGQVWSVLRVRRRKLPPQQAARLWLDQAACMLKYCRELPQNSVLARYEDIVSRDEKGARELFSWLGLPFTEIQRRILFRACKAGAKAENKKLPRPVSVAILRECYFPEGAALYNFEVRAAHGEANAGIHHDPGP
jgi:Sulfotransferase family